MEVKQNIRAEPGQSTNSDKTGQLSSHILFWFLVLFGLAADLWSKKAVFDWLQNTGRSKYSVIQGFLNFVMVENSGGAFGIASDQRVLLMVISFLALIVALWIYLFGSKGNKIIDVALGLFVAGVLGNLWDRVFNHGRVRDFIDVIYWPAFNIADSLLCIAVGLIILSLFIGKPGEERPHPHK